MKSECKSKPDDNSNSVTKNNDKLPLSLLTKVYEKVG